MSFSVRGLLDLDSLECVLELVGPIGAAWLCCTSRIAASCKNAEAFWRSAYQMRERDLMGPPTPDILRSADPSETQPVANTCWRIRFAELYGPEVAKESRREELRQALLAQGLQLRNDSALCAEYVAKGRASVPGGLARVVSTMAEMNFYFTKTTYSDDHMTIQESLHERAWADADAALACGEEEEMNVETYFERFDRHKISEIAKQCALRRYAQQVLDVPLEYLRCAQERLLKQAPHSLKHPLQNLFAGDLQAAWVPPWESSEKPDERRVRLREAARLTQQHLEDSLQGHIEALRRLAQDGQQGESLELPSSISSGARAMLHGVAEDLGLLHESRGVGSTRALVVTRIA